MIEIATIYDKLLLKEEQGYHKLEATRLIRKGEVIMPVTGNISHLRTQHSIQISGEDHISAKIAFPLDYTTESNWRFANHSCVANIYLRFPDLHFVATRDIQPGEELFYNYNTTESELSHPFACNCGNKSCYGIIQGYHYLTAAQRRKIEAITAPHLLAVTVSRK